MELPHQPWITVWVSGSAMRPYFHGGDEERKEGTVEHLKLEVSERTAGQGYGVSGSVKEKNGKAKPFGMNNLKAIVVLDFADNLQDTEAEDLKALWKLWYGKLLKKFPDPPGSSKQLLEAKV